MSDELKRLADIPDGHWFEYDNRLFVKLRSTARNPEMYNCLKQFGGWLSETAFGREIMVRHVMAEPTVRPMDADDAEMLEEIYKLMAARSCW